MFPISFLPVPWLISVETFRLDLLKNICEGVEKNESFFLLGVSQRQQDEFDVTLCYYVIRCKTNVDAFLYDAVVKMIAPVAFGQAPQSQRPGGLVLPQ